MYRCLIWGYSTVFYEHVNLLRFYESRNEIKVVAVTGKDINYNMVCDIPFVKKSRINKEDFDCVVIMSDARNKIQQEAVAIGFSKEVLIGYKALEIVNFSFARFLELKKGIPSILSCNCWGGFTYNSIGEEFRSPFINMYVEEDDYLRFLLSPQEYIETPLRLKHIGYSDLLQKDYPVCELNDITVHCNHYIDFEHAKECWDRRKKRIDWDNLFVCFYTEKLQSAITFDKLPYEKKICFTSLDTSKYEIGLESAVQVPFYNAGAYRSRGLWDCVMATAKREVPFYDIIELLLEGAVKTIVTL